MRLRIMVGLLVLLLGITGYTLYRDSHGATETPAHVYDPSMQTISEEGWAMSTNESTMLVATIRIDLDDALLADMDARSPRLMLEATDGSRAYVTGWRVAKGELVLSQFYNLSLAHYTSLVITWPEGSTQQITVDEDFRKLSQG